MSSKDLEGSQDQEEEQGSRSILRAFEAGAIAASEEWRRRLETDLDWQVEPGAERRQGEASGFFVTAGSLSGYAKPGKNQPPVLDHPRAAHEKIAADLAYELGLPVPPALLWKRTSPGPGEERHTAIVIVPFKPVLPWGDIEQASFKDLFLAGLGPFASAMVPFDTWIQNTDRMNPGNLIGMHSRGNAPEIRVAYIDHSNSLTFAWRNAGRDWHQVEPVGPYPDQCSVDLTSMGRSLKNIENLPDTVIREIVQRIPNEFASQDDLDLICTALLERRPMLRAHLRHRFPELP